LNSTTKLNADPVKAEQLARECVASLERQLRSVGADLEKNRNARHGAAFDAKTGARGAQAVLDGLASEERRLEAEHRDLTTALEEAQRRHVAAEKAIADAKAAANRQQIAQTAVAMKAKLERADELVTALVTTLAEAQGILQDMLRLGASPNLSRLLAKPTINRALHAQGLTRLAEFDPMTIGGGHGQAFGEVAQIFLARLIDGEQTKKAA